jgi:hypothetical protein
MYGFGWNDDKPATHPRYRVGDRVRHKTVHATGTGTVEELKPQSHYLVRWSSAYQLCTDPEDVLLPAFRPGDRVKLNRHYGARACGERGTVSSVLGDAVCVRMDDASLWGTVTAALPAEVLDWERDEGEQHATSARVPWQDDKPQPKFKAGDVVTYKTDKTVCRTISRYKKMYDRDAYEYVDGGFDYEESLELVTAAPCPQDNEQQTWKLRTADGLLEFSSAGLTIHDPQPCIVARVKTNGQPMPAALPHVHASVAAATTEAERLARNNPGQEFAVYQRVVGRKAEQHIEMKEVA